MPRGDRDYTKTGEFDIKPYLKAADQLAERYIRNKGANKLKVNMRHPDNAKAMELDAGDAQAVQGAVRPDLTPELEPEE